MKSSQAAQLRSPVLTAIGIVNGNPSSLTPHRIEVPYPIAKKLSQVITSTTYTAVQNFLEIRPSRASGKIGEI